MAKRKPKDAPVEVVAHEMTLKEAQIKGGHATANKLTPEQRTIKARNAANTMWAKRRQGDLFNSSAA